MPTLNKERARRFCRSWRARTVLVAALAAAIVATPALSTPPSGVVGPILARGTLDGKARLKIKSPRSDVIVQHLTIAPGGDTGWHSHPGPVVVVVTGGKLTMYQGRDRNCMPHEFVAGQTFIDPGRGNVHIARNEGTTPLELYATYLDVPVGGAFRIDAADPGHCSF
jgi:quercetin dioxygenase-like cupin family protein